MLVDNIAITSGWENVSKLNNTCIEISSALHHFRGFIQLVKKEQYKLSFSSSTLSEELAKQYSESSLAQIDGIDTLRLILKKASVLASVLPDTPLQIYLEKIKNLNIDDTTIKNEVTQRIGQTCYRDALIKYWNGKCALTGLDIPELLYASHAKPWADCTTATERLNVFNGLLLESRFDKLFDQGYISFANDGRILISPVLTPSQLQLLGLYPSLQIRRLRPEHFVFLQYHREHIFKKNKLVST